MISIGQLLFNLLITPPGNFIYHLVLVFSVTAAIQALLAKSQANSTQQSQRMLTGLGIILAGQIILFLSSGLTWQNFFDARSFLPPLDRAITLISLLWVGWLWCFPDPSRTVNIITTILSMIIGTCFIITVLYWVRLYQAMPFNGSWPDFGWSIFTLSVIGAAILVLLVEKPLGLGTGMTILGINLAGLFIHTMWTPMVGDFSPAVRYANIISFPLLPLLSQCVKNSFIVNKVETEPRFSIAQKLTPFLALLKLAAKHKSGDIRPALIKTIAETTAFDLGLLISLLKTEGRFFIEAGYDLSAQEFIEPVVLISERFPMFVQSIQSTEVQTFTIEPNLIPDLNILSRTLKIRTILHAIMVPLIQEDQRTRALFLGRQKTGLPITSDEKRDLSDLAHAIAPLLETSIREVTSPDNRKTSQGEATMSIDHSNPNEIEYSDYQGEENDLISSNALSPNPTPEPTATNDPESVTKMHSTTDSSHTVIQPEGPMETLPGTYAYPPHDQQERFLQEYRQLTTALRKVQIENWELLSTIDRLNSQQNEDMVDFIETENTEGAFYHIVAGTLDNFKSSHGLVEKTLSEDTGFETSCKLMDIENKDLKNLLSTLMRQNQSLSQLQEKISNLDQGVYHPYLDQEPKRISLDDLEAHLDENASSDVEDTDQIVVKPRPHKDMDGESTQPVKIPSKMEAKAGDTRGTLPAKSMNKTPPEWITNASLIELGNQLADIHQEVNQIGNSIQARHESLNYLLKHDLPPFPPPAKYNKSVTAKDLRRFEDVNGTSSVAEMPWREDEQLRVSLQDVIDASQEVQNGLKKKLEDMEQLIDNLKLENEDLQKELLEAQASLNQTTQRKQETDTELRMTLEEVARLQELIAQKEQRESND